MMHWNPFGRVREHWLVVALTLALAIGIAYRQSAERKDQQASQERINRTAVQLSLEGARLSRLIELVEDSRFQRPRKINEAAELTTIFERIRQRSPLNLVWIQLRDPKGALQARAGLDVNPVFHVGFVKSHSRNNQPVLKVVSTQAGTLVVEAFPIYWRGAAPHAAFLNASNMMNSPLQSSLTVGTIELAARVVSDKNGNKNGDKNSLDQNTFQRNIRPPAAPLVPMRAFILYSPTIFYSPKLSKHASGNHLGALISAIRANQRQGESQPS